MTDKITSQLIHSKSNEEAEKHWEHAKHMYMREITEIKQNHETQIHKLDLTIGKPTKITL
jgi:hypothetical protein